MKRSTLARGLLLGLAGFAAATAARKVQTALTRRRDRERTRGPSSSAGDAPMPTAGLLDHVAANAGVVLPTMAKGLIIRRRSVVAAAERMNLDTLSVRTMQGLRNRYGDGPVLVRNVVRPHRHMAMILAPEDARRVLDETPEPFATATAEKHGALAHFEPKVSLISHGEEREERVRFNREVLDADRHTHRMADVFLDVIDEEAREIDARASRRGELVWEDFFDPWYRMVRRIIFGPGAADDRELTEMISQLRARGNWSFLAPPDRELRSRFLSRVREHLDRAEPGSIAAIIATTETNPVTAPEHQIPQWLFAFDPGAIAAYRGLALLAAHPDAADRARAEIRERAGSDRHHLPFLRATVLESLRLWPTTPLVLRETTEPTRWRNGVMPAHTHVVLFAPFFHRDDERLPWADRFAPEVWLERGASDTLDSLSPADWPLMPFSSGPGICPGRHVVLLTASAMMAALIRDRDLVLDRPARLQPRRRLPGTLDHFDLRFRFVQA